MELSAKEKKEYKKALEKFNVPADYEHFLFTLPLYFVAIADGEFDSKEVINLPFIKVSHKLIGRSDTKELKLRKEFTSQINDYLGENIKPKDMHLLAKAINYKLREYSPDDAMEIRTNMYQACIDVAKVSGERFHDNMCREEKDMIDEIFKIIGKGKLGKTKK